MDAYDQAIEYFETNSEKIIDAWRRPHLEHGGVLFGFTGEDRFSALDADCRIVGCVTQVRHANYNAGTPELTSLIRLDDRIPMPEQNYLEPTGELTWDSLPVFADWQRRVDQELGRTPPPLDPALPAPTRHFTADAPAKPRWFRRILRFFAA